jgi:putative transposase
MSRKNRSPEENARRAKIRELLQMENIDSMDDIRNLFRETIAEFMENGLEAELDEDLGYSKYDYKNKATDNSRNGHSSKNLQTSFGEVEVSVPRDRKGEFEPQLLKKNQTSISQDIEEKILSMYAKGMTTGDIEAHIQDIYGLSVSDTTVSRITDKILPVAKEWQQRPLESIYAVVFLDAIHYHVRSEGQIVKKAVYIAIGLDLDGRKDALGMWVGENESVKFWATVLNGPRNRSVEDIFIACTDNLTGFDAAIHAVFPETEIQNCMIHQLRNSSKYVSYKDLKALMSDLKAVYAAVDEQAALDALETFAQNWDNKYPKIAKSWRENWANLSTYFKYPQEVRRLIYTTNTIEGFNRQLRKVTKSKSVFPTDESLLKMLYLAMMDITKSGQVGGRTGAASMHSCPSTSLSVCRINTCRGGMSRVYERLRRP